MEGIQHLKIPLQEIMTATNNFSDEKCIGRGGFGKVYLAELSLSGQPKTVAIKRLDHTLGQGRHEFLMEIQLLSCYRHNNIISLLGFCYENGEKILVYEYAKHGSLDKHISIPGLTWLQRLHIIIGAARGINYLHDELGPHHRVHHRDIKSSNILLNENWEAKVSDFGLSKIGPSNVEFTFLVTNVCGTEGYVDPEYVKTGTLTKESDVYSFGVMLFEILCGKLAHKTYHDGEGTGPGQRQGPGLFLSSLAKKYYEQNRLVEIIHPSLKTQIKADSFELFSTVAYQCLNEKRSERPTMAWIVEKMQKVLKLQEGGPRANFVRIGTWDENQNRHTRSHWSVLLEEDHQLVKITIDHGAAIHSLMFTSECSGVMHTSGMVGGKAKGENTSEVILGGDEEIIGIDGTITHEDGYTIVSSLSIETTKRVHGPFGRPTNDVFKLPCTDGSIVGFYGFANDYIESIGVYAKPSAAEAVIRVGKWGKAETGRRDNNWSFQVEKKHHLKKIKIGHGDLIYSFLFTTDHMGMSNTSMAGGWRGSEKSSEITFDWDEEIEGISGTVGSSRGEDADQIVISSISFITNKGTYGPFGNVRGTPFMVKWDDAARFAGFYGLCGWYIDNIGIYLKPV